jgi:hypothetical protein
MCNGSGHYVGLVSKVMAEKPEGICSIAKYVCAA